MRGRLKFGALAVVAMAAGVTTVAHSSAAAAPAPPTPPELRVDILTPDDFPEAYARIDDGRAVLAPSIATAGTQFAGFNSVTPARILETRPGFADFNGVTAIGPNAAIDVQVSGRAGVPADAGAVVLNVTVTAPTLGGYLTVWPAGTARPDTSSLNMVAGQTVPNAVVVKLGSTGKVSVYNNAGVSDVLIDVVAWSRNDGHFVGLPPARVLDTRAGSPIAAGATVDLKVTGVGGVPATGVSTVVLNVTATQPTSASYLTVWAAGSGQPNASNLNMASGQTVPNVVFAPVGADGKISIFNERGTTHLLADVVGYIPIGTAYVPLNPTRVMDTRISSGVYGIPGSGSSLSKPAGKLGTRQTFNLDVAAALSDKYPLLTLSTVQALMFNVTALDATAASFLTVYPAGEAKPNASSVNMSVGQITANAVVVKAGNFNRVSIYNHEGATNVIVDLVGFVPRQNAGDTPDGTNAAKFHVVYVQGSDSVADPNVVIPVIRNEVEALDGWFALPAQAGRHLNIDRVGAQIEVSVVKYARFTTNQLVNWDSDPLLSVFAQLIDDGFASTFKRLSLVYFDGNRTDGVCGIAYLQFTTVFMQNSCGTVNGFTPAVAVGASANMPQVALHEMLHGLGAVPACAPHHSLVNRGHVTDPNDLMYFSASNQPKQLDIDRDDYYGHSIPNCLDVEDSPFIAAP